MRKYKIIKDGYIFSVGIGNNGIQITDEEYDLILNIIKNKPQKTEYIDYKLNELLEWVAYDFVPDDPIDMPNDVEYAQAGKIMLGEGD